MLTLKCPNCGHTHRPDGNPCPACGKTTRQAVNDINSDFLMPIAAFILVLVVLWIMFD